MDFQDQYRRKRASAADAVRQVRNGDMIIVPTGVGEPPALLEALSEQRRDFRDVKVAQILAMRKYAYIDPETVAHVRHVALFFGGATRAGGQEGWIDSAQLLRRSPRRSSAARSRPTWSSAWPRRWTRTATSR